MLDITDYVNYSWVDTVASFELWSLGVAKKSWNKFTYVREISPKPDIITEYGIFWSDLFYVPILMKSYV